MLFCGPYTVANDEIKTEFLTPEALDLLREFNTKAQSLSSWDEESIGALVKAILKEHSLKMPKLAVPLRVAVTGRKHTPSINTVLALLGKETVISRLQDHI